MSTDRSREFQPINFKTRFPALDGVRALAITLVFAEHYGGGSHGGGVLKLVNQVRLRGWLGVDIFFVLSGFLITGILHDTLGDSHFMSRFFARRSLRILPLYYGVFVLLLLLMPVMHYQWRPGHAWFLLYLGNFAGNWNFDLYHVFSRTHYWWSANLAHFWSLCVEEQFYLLWPWVVFAVKSRRRLIAVAAGLSVAALLSRVAFLWWVGPTLGERWIVRSLPFRADALLIGGLLALLLRGPAADRVQRSCKWVLAGAGLLALAIFVWSPEATSPWMLTIGYSLTALASAGLIGMTLREGSPLFRAFHVRPLRTLGKYSYGFYVYHALFFYVWLRGLERLIHRFHSLVLAGLIETAGAFAVTFVVAKLSFDLYESRFLRWKRHFEYDSERQTHQHAFVTE